jgi:predicted ribosomally synthesized peptide with nif11-like leader
MTHATFDEFRRAVLADQSLQEKLRDIPDSAIFVEQTLVLGQALGYTFTADDIKNAMQASRRAWIERWIR